MTQENRIYRLRLSDDFFSDKVMKKLRKYERGGTYVIIYLKILLAAMKNNGVIDRMGLENTFAEELALDFNEEANDVAFTLCFLRSLNLAQTEDNESYFFPEALARTYSETASTIRSRECRKRKKELSKPTCVTQKEKETENEKETEEETEKDTPVTAKEPKRTRHKYGQYSNVLLTDEDLLKLKTEFPSDWSSRIEKLSSYIASTGKKYKNHLATIRNWAKNDEVKEEPKDFFNDFLSLDGLI